MTSKTVVVGKPVAEMTFAEKVDELLRIVDGNGKHKEASE